MSILIKNMEMPKDCPYCPLAHWNLKNEFTGCEIVKKYFSTEEMYADGKPDFCPLVPVPSHGRLIDADAVVVAIQNSIEVVHDGMQKILLDYAQKMFNATPTIIEAEEGE